MAAGSAPTDWRHRRVNAQLTLIAPVPFVDIEHPSTWRSLEHDLASELAALDVTNLDVSVVRGKRRLVTRLLAKWAYLETDPTGEPMYSGIRYVSKLGQHECWALFDATAYDPTGTEPIELDDAFREVCATLGLIPN